MNWNAWIRQIHRWLSVAFAAAVVVNIVAMAQAEPAVWVGLLALFPLILLLVTGLYLFALPYAARRRGRPRPNFRAARHSPPGGELRRAKMLRHGQW